MRDDLAEFVPLLAVAAWGTAVAVLYLKPDLARRLLQLEPLPLRTRLRASLWQAVRWRP